MVNIKKKYLKMLLHKHKKLANKKFSGENIVSSIILLAKYYLKIGNM